MEGTPAQGKTREQEIVRTSAVGIAANVLLAGAKAAVAAFTNSIAVLLDAVNNLSDALSSVITMVGAKLAGRRPDKKHPLGHGRIEYLSAMIVSAIVLYAGISALVESAKKIFFPEPADYTPVSLAVLAVAIAVKLALGRYVRRKGREVRSASLEASGSDALFDAILSASVLLCAAANLLWHVQLEAWVGAVIAGFITRSGVEMLRDTLDEILGKRADRELLAEIRRTICEEECVSGAYDLILHSYGPEMTVGSVHVEVPDTMTADEIDLMERRVAQRVLQRNGVVLTGIGIYSVNTKDDAAAEMRSRVTRIAAAHEGVLQVHGFYADLSNKTMNLDVILDLALDDREQVFAQIRREIQEAYPGYALNMTMDIDI